MGFYIVGGAGNFGGWIIITYSATIKSIIFTSSSGWTVGYHNASFG